MAGFPQIRSHAISGSTSLVTSHTITQPASIVNGDLLIAIFGAAQATTSITPPAGWTTQYSNLATTTDRWIVAYKYASSESGTYSFTTGATCRSNCWIGSIRGAHASTPFDVQSNNRTTATTITFARPTPNYNGCLVLAAGIVPDGGVYNVGPLGFISTDPNPTMLSYRQPGNGNTNTTLLVGAFGWGNTQTPAFKANLSSSLANNGMVFNIRGTDDTADVTDITVNQYALLTLGTESSPVVVNQLPILVLGRELPTVIFTEFNQEYGK